MNKLLVSLIVFFLCACFVSDGRSDSLWSDSFSGRGSLFADDKSMSIGDIVTIVISESTTASRSSETKTAKDVSNKGSITSFLYPQSASGALTHNDALPAWEYGVQKDFNGKGEIAEKDSLTAKITARVIDVYPNGNLMIQGERELSVANDKKKIIITGVIRRSDIGPDNTVESNLMADAKIYYEGKGPIADNQRRGVMTWLRDVLAVF